MEYNNGDKLTINPEKIDEVGNRIAELLNKKDKTKDEEAELWVLCLVAFQLKPKELRKLTKWIANKIPDKNIKTRKQIEKDIEKILEKSMIITKKLS